MFGVLERVRVCELPNSGGSWVWPVVQPVPPALSSTSVERQLVLLEDGLMARQAAGVPPRMCPVLSHGHQMLNPLP